MRLGWKSSSRTAWSTRSRASWPTLPLPLSTRETVADDTPARRATSRTVAMRLAVMVDPGRRCTLNAAWGARGLRHRTTDIARRGAGAIQSDDRLRRVAAGAWPKARILGERRAWRTRRRRLHRPVPARTRPAAAGHAPAGRVGRLPQPCLRPRRSLSLRRQPRLHPTRRVAGGLSAHAGDDGFRPRGHRPAQRARHRQPRHHGCGGRHGRGLPGGGGGRSVDLRRRAAGAGCRRRAACAST